MNKNLLLGAALGASAAIGGTLGVDALAASQLKCNVLAEKTTEDVNLAQLQTALGVTSFREAYCLSDGVQVNCRIVGEQTFDKLDDIPEGSQCSKPKPPKVRGKAK